MELSALFLLHAATYGVLPMTQSEAIRRKTQSEKDQAERNKSTRLFDNRFYCKKEVAKILLLSVKTIDVMMKEKRIEFLKLGAAVRFNGNYLNEKFGG